MISFFRRIRKNMADDNRPLKPAWPAGRYARYAIGEIILVVIGILIALQINNWNEAKKELKKEQQILLNLREEFQQNIKELQFDHKINVDCISATVTLLNFDNSKNFDTKTIDSLIGKMFNYATFDARLGVMNDIISSGNLELIRDPELKYALNQWTGELEDYKEDVIIRRDYWVSNVPPIMNRLLPIRNADATMDREDYRRDIVIQPIQVPKSNYVEFLTNLEVDNMLFDYYMNQSFVTVNEDNIMKFLEETLRLIDSNIE